MGHVSVVSGFFHDETVTIPVSVWNYGVMEKFLTAAQATHILHGWDKVADSLELMRSRDQSVIKPVVIID
jgi:hypothetical protein